MGETIDQLEEENERKSLEMSIEQKKALVAEARRRYGKDWKKFIPLNWKTGIDWDALRFSIK
jgi:hypothetical protein